MCCSVVHGLYIHLLFFYLLRLITRVQHLLQLIVFCLGAAALGLPFLFRWLTVFILICAFMCSISVYDQVMVPV